MTKNAKALKILQEKNDELRRAEISTKSEQQKQPGEVRRMHRRPRRGETRTDAPRRPPDCATQGGLARGGARRPDIARRIQKYQFQAAAGQRWGGQGQLGRPKRGNPKRNGCSKKPFKVYSYIDLRCLGFRV